MTAYSARRQLAHRLAVLMVLASAGSWAAWFCQVRFEGIAGSIPAILSVLSGFVPDWSAADEILPEAVTTLLLAAAATLLGLILSLPLGLAAASNVAPFWLRHPTRLLLAVERATPEVLLLLFFVVAFGLGAFAGIVTLGMASVAMLGKLLADRIEEVDGGVIESVKATGAAPWQTIRYAIIPEVLPALVANTLFRFDYNMRSTVILGAAGAGGLGHEILMSVSRLRYERAALAALFSLALILAAEQISMRARSRWAAEAVR